MCFYGDSANKVAKRSRPNQTTSEIRKKKRWREKLSLTDEVAQRRWAKEKSTYLT